MVYLRWMPNSSSDANSKAEALLGSKKSDEQIDLHRRVQNAIIKP